MLQTLNQGNKKSCDDHVTFTMPFVRISLLLFPLACLEKNMGVVHPKSEWLKSTLFPKICKWAEQSIDSDTLAKDEVISMKRYCTLYKELKLKHGPYLIDVSFVISLFIFTHN